MRRNIGPARCRSCPACLASAQAQVASGQNNKGFSLIGVIVSMVALGIMATAAMPVLKGILFKNQANNVSVLANTLINAESTYVNNNSQFSGISGLQTAGYLAQGLGIDFVANNPHTDCIYGSITAKNDTKICLSVNDANRNGTSQEISYTLTIMRTADYPAPNYYNYYIEIKRNIPGSSIINGDEIEYIDPIALSNTGGVYNQYIGKSFYITGATCYITETDYFTYITQIWYGGQLSLYFMVEAIDGNNAILSYTNDPISSCNYNAYSQNYGNITDSYGSQVVGAFQNAYLPQVRGVVELYPFGGYGEMSYVPIEPPGYEIEIPVNHLPYLIHLNQLNTVN